MIKKSCIYFSIINDCLVRVIGLDKAMSLALVKHHDDELKQEEVFLEDLQPVGKEEVMEYLGMS
jgi:hypothetical protein